MKYVVAARDLKWAGERLLRGAEVKPKSDRDHQHLELLAKLGKIELAPEKKPVRQVDSTRAPEHTYRTAAVKEAAPVAPLTTEDIEPPKRTYSTRRLKAED